MGNIVALATAPLLINRFGWESAFWVYGTLGLTWLLPWVTLVPDQPPQRRLQGGMLSCPMLNFSKLLSFLTC